MDSLIGCKIIGGDSDPDEAYIDVQDELRDAKFRIYFSITEDEHAPLEVEVVPWVPRPPERRKV